MGKKGLFFVLVILLALLRSFLFPLELTGDSYGYACEIIKGELLSPHHLLPKFILRDLWIITHPFNLIADPLLFFQSVHLIFGILSILILIRILELRHWSKSRIYSAALMVFSSFVFIKYSAENEVYFYPIFFSLLGSLYFEKGKYFTAALWLGISTLFHQTHLFWLIGVLIPRPQQSISRYFPLLLGLIIPIIVYFSLSLFSSTALNELLFHDVNEGLVQTIPNGSNFKFFILNLFRVFVQIHGDFILFWKLWNPYYSGLALLNLIIIGIGFVIFIKGKANILRRIEWIPAYSIALGLHLLFAWYSVGNIEFMIVAPFLLVLSFRSGEILRNSLLLFVGILVWNFSQWVLPMTKYPTQRLKEMIEITERITNKDTFNNHHKNQWNTIYVQCESSALIQNYYEYHQIKDSSISSTRTFKSKLPIQFVDFNSKLNHDLTILQFHERKNRSQLTQVQKNLDTTMMERVYRDSGMIGILEFWKINKNLNSPI